MSEPTPRIERYALARRADGLSVGIEIAEQDWRDLLVPAGLEHGNWGDALDRLIAEADRWRRSLTPRAGAARASPRRRGFASRDRPR